MNVSESAKIRLVKLAIDACKRAIQNDENDGEGCFNYFVRVTEHWGAKVSKCQSYATIGNFDRQKAAAEHGLGPTALCMFSFMVFGEPYEAYITEIVDCSCQLGYFDYYEGKNQVKQVARLVRLLKSKTDFAFSDCHYKNVGFKGKIPVCIDFDDHGDW